MRKELLRIVDNQESARPQPFYGDPRAQIAKLSVHECEVEESTFLAGGRNVPPLET